MWLCCRSLHALENRGNVRFVQTDPALKIIDRSVTTSQIRQVGNLRYREISACENFLSPNDLVVMEIRLNGVWKKDKKMYHEENIKQTFGRMHIKSSLLLLSLRNVLICETNSRYIWFVYEYHSGPRQSIADYISSINWSYFLRAYLWRRTER